MQGRALLGTGLATVALGLLRGLPALNLSVAAAAAMVIVNTGDRPTLFAAQFALSHACSLLTYPLAGSLGATIGPGPAFLVLAALAMAGLGAAAALWPRHDPEEIEHDHAGLPPEHPHPAARPATWTPRTATSSRLRPRTARSAPFWIRARLRFPCSTTSRSAASTRSASSSESWTETWRLTHALTRRLRRGGSWFRSTAAIIRAAGPGTACGRRSYSAPSAMQRATVSAASR